MSFEPNPKQALFLWTMITGETPEIREPLLSKAQPTLDAKKERKPLLDHGFLAVGKRPGQRGTVLSLTDKGWQWASLSGQVQIAKSQVAAQALQGLLRRLIPYLTEQDIPLADLFPENAARAKQPPDLTPSSDDSGGTLAERIEGACLELAGGRKKERIRLSELRPCLPTVAREQLDRELVLLQRAGRLVLYRDDNTSSLTPADHEAALIVADSPRHLVYLED